MGGKTSQEAVGYHQVTLSGACGTEESPSQALPDPQNHDRK